MGALPSNMQSEICVVGCLVDCLFDIMIVMVVIIILIIIIILLLLLLMGAFLEQLKAAQEAVLICPERLSM